MITTDIPGLSVSRIHIYLFGTQRLTVKVMLVVPVGTSIEN